MSAPPPRPPPPPPPPLPPPENPPTGAAPRRAVIPLADIGSSILASGGLAGLKKVQPSASSFTKLELENATHEWLKYEALYNHTQFQHTAERLPFASYTFPLDKLRVVLLPGLSETALTRIRTAFFPDLDSNDALRACCFHPWDRDQKGSGTGDKIKGIKAHMPYNAIANDEASVALGTRAVPPDAPVDAKLVGEWAMWQTASRSCVIELASSKDWQVDPQPPRDVGPYKVLPFEFATPENRTKGYRDVRPELPGTRATKTVSGLFEATSTTEPVCWSVKTGVKFVGTMNQDGKYAGEKGTLEKESLAAALRSNYVIELERFLKAQAAKALPNSQRLVVLPEVLTVTCIDPDLDGKTGDGFQLRDLSRLNRDRVYFPALSIPYIGRTADKGHPINYDIRSEYFAGLQEAASKDAALTQPADWATHWSNAFAARVGQAKALLHFVYGLQPLTPNAQNFLLESELDMAFTGRVVCRDILDMKLHSDWIATIFGPNPLDTTPVSLTKLEFKGPKEIVDLLAYERDAPSIIHPGTGESMIGDSETFADIPGPPPYYKGTQLNWFPYTALHRGSAVADAGAGGSAGPARPAGWQVILYVNALWGLQHAINYANVVNHLLEGAEPDAKVLTPIDYNTFFNGIALNFAKGKESNGLGFLAGGAADPHLKVFGKDPDANSAPFAFVANAMEFQGLKDEPAGWKRAGELHELFCQWERSVSAKIHSAIYDTKEGREKLRRFHGL